MANLLLQTLIPVFSFIALVHSKDVVTSFTYQGGAGQSLQAAPGYTYQGDARDRADILALAGINSSGNITKLSVGRVLQSEPVRLSSFGTYIEFVIKPSRNGAAEGMAFFIAPVGTTIPAGSAGGNLGIFNGPKTPNVFAVEFDTNYNGWDPKYNHIGIDIQSRTSSKVAKFDAGTGDLVRASIVYNEDSKTITVDAVSGSQSVELSYEFDLKTVLPERVQVGLTSSTGTYISAVGLPEIQRWEFASFLKSDDGEPYIRQIV